MNKMGINIKRIEEWANDPEVRKEFFFEGTEPVRVERGYFLIFAGDYAHDVFYKEENLKDELDRYALKKNKRHQLIHGIEWYIQPHFDIPELLCLFVSIGKEDICIATFHEMLTDESAEKEVKEFIREKLFESNR